MRPKTTPNRPTRIVTLDNVADSFDAHRLTELPADLLERLCERAAVVKVRLDFAMALGARNGDSPQAAMLSVAEAAKLIGRSPAWLRRIAKQRNLSFCHRLSRKLMMVDRAGLENWIATRRT